MKRGGAWVAQRIEHKGPTGQVWLWLWLWMEGKAGRLLSESTLRSVVCVMCYVLSCVQLFATPGTIQPARLLCPWNFPGKNIAEGCHFLLQGIFLTQGSNLHLFHLLRWQVDSLLLYYLASPMCNTSSYLGSIIIWSWQ